MSDTEPKKEKLNTIQIVGIIIGICVLVVLLFLLYRHFGPKTRPSLGGVNYIYNGNYVHTNKPLFEKYGYN